MEEHEVIHVAQIGCPQYFGHEVIETIEIKVGEELASQVADRQTATAPEGCKEVVAVEVEIDRLLRVGSINNHIEQCQR